MNLQIDLDDIVDVTDLSETRIFKHQRRKNDLIKLIEKHIPSGSRLLDVGCASGDIAIELAFMGYKVHGIDFEPKRLEKARKLAEKYGQDVTFTQSSFDDFNPNEKYDGIVLGEIIEHFSDPGAMLTKAEQFLENNGKMIVTTPNMPSLNNRLKFGILGIFPDNNSEHKFYFDYRRFREVVDKTNLVIESFETHYANLQTPPLLPVALESMLLGWFPKLFRKSGDSIHAVLIKSNRE